MAETTTTINSKVNHAKCEDLPRQPPYDIVVSGTGVQGGLRDTQLEDFARQIETEKSDRRRI